MINNPFLKTFWGKDEPGLEIPKDDDIITIEEPEPLTFESFFRPILNYVKETPHNTNPAILLQMLKNIDTTILSELKGERNSLEPQLNH